MTLYIKYRVYSRIHNEGGFLENREHLTKILIFSFFFYIKISPSVLKSGGSLKIGGIPLPRINPANWGL